MSTQGTPTVTEQTESLTYEAMFNTARPLRLVDPAYELYGEGEKLLAALRFAHKLLPEPGPVFTVRERAGMLLLPHRRGAYSERARTFAKALHYGTHEGDAASQVLAALEASGAEWDEDGGRWYLP